MWKLTAFGSDGKAISTAELASGEVTIGRENDRKLVLPSGSVSRRHAKLYVDRGRLYVMDEGSANGVFVDGQKIAGPTPVTVASAVTIAEFRIGIEAQGAPPTLRLVGEGGTFDGRIFELPQGQTGVGRAADNELSFDDASLSRKHARLMRVGPMRVEVEDLGSSNGTYVNGHRIQGRVALSPGDLVRFGELQFRLQVIEADGTRLVEPIPLAPQGGSSAAGLIVMSVLTIVIIGLAVAALLREPPTVRASGTDAIAKLVAKADEHARAGKALYKDKKYTEAKAELEAALEYDPANVEVARLRRLALHAREDENAYTAAVAKIGLGDRKGLEGALGMLNEISVGSLQSEQLSSKLITGLINYGYQHCDGKQYAECGWALCKASELQGGKLDPTADKRLAEAEKKLEHDKTYTVCPRK